MTAIPPADPGRLRIETRGAESTDEALAQIYSCTQFRHDGEPSVVDITRGRLGRITLDTLKFSETVTYDIRSLSQICICRVHSGYIETRASGRVETSVAGDLIIYPASKERHSGRIHQASFDLTMLEVAEFNHLAPAAPDVAKRSVLFTGYRPISRTAADRLSRLIDFLQKQMFATPTSEQSPELTSLAAQGLAATVLAALPRTAVLAPTYIDRRGGQQPALLSRATAFIAENAHTDIALADIAAALDVTPRAVQYVFRNHLDISPMEHLRRTRLRLAHQDLVKNDESTTTVEEIARKWGYANYTRFVARYKREYNCNPAKTLHSS